ncbi:MAG: hypothetical protein FJ221_17860 [Lentisphaerae bacterium]|nr:hypothetical protein [Lentisphaerota bacterium]
MKPSSSRRGGPADARVRRLAEWLREWAVDRALRDEPAGPSPAAGESSACYDDVPGTGDIRVLHPASAPSAERPLHVALLDRAASGAWLAAPFSRFANPATPGEWLTGRRAAALRVLCPWNVRWMPSATVLRSWRTGRLTPRERDGALRVLEAWRRGTPPEPAIEARTGLPVIHPDDPRRVYEDEESRVMDEAAAEPDDRPQVLPGPAGRGGRVYEVPDASWLKAAEPEKGKPDGDGRIP